MNKNILRVISIMTLIVIIGFGIAHFYYKSVNDKEDPRVVEAKVLYKDYNAFLKDNNFKGVLEILNKIEQIYAKEPHYKNSYEAGVVCTDKAALFLALAIHKDSMVVLKEHLIKEVDLSKDSLLTIAEKLIQQSISIYENWMEEYKGLDENAIREKIKNNFQTIDATEEQKNKYLEKRVKDIQIAKIETPRRLSVSYTNLGIVKRHRELYAQAVEMYKKALELWDKNMTAKNNLNVLLGRPMEHQSIIDHLFPPERIDEKDSVK